MAKKRIAVLTSGGDAPGMNDAVRAVVRASINNNIDVYGIYRGFAGLLEEDIRKMQVRSVSNIINRGGTMLHSSRCPEMLTEEGQAKAAQILKDRKIDHLICIGGDGTFRGALSLAKHGIQVIGVPATIDNDIGCSEYTIGFDTAINTAVDLADKIRDTTMSHDRCSIVEVMGRKCGELAIYTGIAIGAYAVLVPEIETNFEEDILKPMLSSREQGRKHFVIVVAEGVGGSEQLALKIEKETGITTRATILGHVQRGGSPSEKDRVTASIMGVRAVILAATGISNRVVVVKNNEVTDVDINEALSMQRVFNMDMYQVAKRLSV